VLHHMEDYRQTEFPHLRVWLTSTTEQWGVIALQGPSARAMLAPLVQDIDLGAMRHMTVQSCQIGGVAARLFRVSFTGESGYEINLPAGFLQPVWEALIEAGATPYGTDAMHMLRAEKGYIIVGQETDGTVTPDDLGLGRLISRGKHDFVGKRSLRLPDLSRTGRRQLVGLLTQDPRTVLEEGAQIVADPRGAVPAAMLGHVTSAYHSATLDRSIALALLENGRAQQGNTLYVPMPDGVIPVGVTAPMFYDPGGERLHG
jgi:sarcosine oxidase, subunit alpha